jgi:hypothetical protein
VALTFPASERFAYSKPRGVPCVHLDAAFRCSIHDTRTARGFGGCLDYDCLGAGQRVVGHTFAGADWRRREVAAPMFEVFSIVRGLHEQLWYLSDALSRPAAQPVHDDLMAAAAEVEGLADAPADELLSLDLHGPRQRVLALLARTSRLVRDAAPGPRPDHEHADLGGRGLAGADLRGANLRGTSLARTDLSGADLRLADLFGADLTGADLAGADLSSTLFCTPPQLHRARGDRATRLPSPLEPAPGWAGTVRLGPTRRARR